MKFFMSFILAKLKGVVCMIDDVLVCGSTYKEHNKRLQEALNWLQSGGVTLNTEICQFQKTSVQFLGQMIDGQGVRPDPVKLKPFNNLSGQPLSKYFIGL